MFMLFKRVWMYSIVAGVAAKQIESRFSENEILEPKKNLLNN